MSILNDLFEQILHSEEKVREHFSKLRAVNNEIQESQLRIRSARDELKSLQGALYLNNQRLSEAEMTLKWYSIHAAVLREKEHEMTRKKANLEAELEKIEGGSVLKRMKFTAEVSLFTSMCDFTGNGKEMRAADAREKLAKLKQEEDVLQKELCGLQQDMQDLDSLRKERDEQISHEAQLKVKLKGLEDQLESEKDKTRLAEKDKHKALGWLHKDPEFQRLSAELEAAKDGTMEGICEALGQELKELQQVYLQEKLQKQQQQQRRQNRATQPTHKGYDTQQQTQGRGRAWRDQLNKDLPSLFSVVDSSDEEMQ